MKVSTGRTTEGGTTFVRRNFVDAENSRPFVRQKTSLLMIINIGGFVDVFAVLCNVKVGCFLHIV